MARGSSERWHRPGGGRACERGLRSAGPGLGRSAAAAAAAAAAALPGAGLLPGAGGWPGVQSQARPERGPSAGGRAACAGPQPAGAG